METEPIIDIALSEIGESYAGLRIVSPAADLSMVESMEKYGQLSPLVVCRLDGKRYELLDGFKRLRAARKLNRFKSLKARPLEVGVHAAKAAIVQLNWVGRSINDMEEAMVVHSLHREDALTQVEIATLLGRHKSWVCRRISLIDRLSDEVKQSIRLGLISVSTGWELTRLQRCNQEAALSAIQGHRLSLRESKKLISALLSRPRWEHEAILRCPEEMVLGSPPAGGEAKDNRLSQAARVLNRRLMSLEGCCLSVAGSLGAEALSHLSKGDMLYLSPIIGRAIGSAELVVESLKKALQKKPSENTLLMR